MSTTDYISVNREAWNKRTKLHVESSFYDVKSFVEGKNTLNQVELEQLGSVKGKSLLHLQCHFGLDTMSWARLGADVTGVDLSSESIKQARELAESTGISAQFIESDVIAFGERNSKQYDIVFSSYGALCWLPNLNDWAKVIANALSVGGEFHLVEFHTFNDVFSGYSYFPEETPSIDQDGTYTENCDGETSTMMTWSHPVSEVITALLEAGLTLESFSEYPFSPYNCFEGLEYVEGKGYQMLHKGQQVPLLYSVKMSKTTASKRMASKTK